MEEEEEQDAGGVTVVLEPCIKLQKLKLYTCVCVRVCVYKRIYASLATIHTNFHFTLLRRQTDNKLVACDLNFRSCKCLFNHLKMWYQQHQTNRMTTKTVQQQRQHDISKQINVAKKRRWWKECKRRKALRKRKAGRRHKLSEKLRIQIFVYTYVWVYKYIIYKYSVAKS